MAYATVDDVLARYTPLQTLVGSGPSDVSTVEIASVFLADAESYVNAFIGAKYQTPVQPEPLITQITCDIAICKILQDKAPRIPDYMQGRCSNVNSMLAMLRDGTMVLTASGTLPLSGGGSNEFVWSNVDPDEGFPGPIFNPLEARSFSHRL